MSPPPNLTYTELQSFNAHAAADLLLANSLTWTGEVSAEVALDHLFAALHRCRAGVSKESVQRAVDLLRRQANAWEAGTDYYTKEGDRP